MNLREDDAVVLFRPVGGAELHLIEASNMAAFPPRLPQQPIFYPVTNQKYAEEIALHWNARHNADHLGYVTRFSVRAQFIRRYDRNIVGARHHEEYWIPAEDLPEFNVNIVGRIEVVARYALLDGREVGGE